MSSLPGPAPLILTAALDPLSAAVFGRQRDRHFPPERNIVPAHLTLFHHLPGEEAPQIVDAVAAACRGSAPIPFATTGFRFLGRGVAYEVAASALVALRARLAALWTDRLTAQDRQPFRPHVTIQNKAAPAEARALLDRLQAEVEPVAGLVVGLDLWVYRGGPWEAAGRFAFTG